MNIGVVGLGLIGASMAKAIGRAGNDRVFGYDINRDVMSDAICDGVICGEIELDKIDLLLLALYPQASIDYVEKHKKEIPKGCTVCDLCGVKQAVCEKIGQIAREEGFTFVGGHPMAGRELSGFVASKEDLFDGASMILTPDDGCCDKLCEFFKSLGFAKVVCTTPYNHDKMIAFTSQLAHVVSSAYIKSPEASRHEGYSAGSYRDLTRVARLNENMWTELFLLNRAPLVREIDTIIANLKDYRDAIYENDEARLHRLLKEGRERKEQIDREIEN